MFRLALALVAAAAPAAEKDPWVRVSTAHFEVYTDAGDRSGRDVARHFEQVHSFFQARFQTGIETGRRARVILFRNEREYEAYRPTQSAAAFFHPGEYRDFIVMHAGVTDWRPTAVHELTHLMLHQFAQELPLWLNEGMAELYSNMEPRGSQVMVGRDIPGRMHVLATDRWLPLRTLLTVGHDSSVYTERDRSGIFYAESWKLVHMLHLNHDYSTRLTELVRALLKGGGESAFRSVYGKELPAVEEDLRNYLSGNTITALLFNITLPKNVDAPEIEPGASMYSRLALAELLSNSRGKSEQAKAAYAAIAKEYPERWEVEEAQGLFAWHERQMEEANRHFSRAQELGCRNGPTYLLWGRVLGYSNHPKEAVAVLSKAANLLPDNIEAQLEYGNALVRNGNWGAAVAALRGIRSVPETSAWRYCYNLAFGLYRLGKPEEARPILAKARQYAVTDRERSSLDSLEAALARPVRVVNDAPVVAIDVGEKPKLSRRDPAPEMPVKRGPAPPSLEGTLENMECGKVARLHVRASDGMKIFVIPDPTAIQIVSGSGASVDLQCGTQKPPIKMRIGYQEMPEASGVTGFVRTLEFK